MKLFFGSLAAVFFAIFFVMWLLLRSATGASPNGENAIIEFYVHQARTPMFTGFLTLGSFLLALQTALIQRLKEAFDTKGYQTIYLQHLKKDRTAKYYGPLENVGLALTTNVLLALATSVSQLTIGYFKSELSTALCISMAVVTVALVAYLTIQLLLAHRRWFEEIEKNKQDALPRS